MRVGDIEIPTDAQGEIRVRYSHSEPRRFIPAWTLLAERPCHLLIESGGSGGAHAYWKLAEPLAATRLAPGTGEVIEPIEQANFDTYPLLTIAEMPNVRSIVLSSDRPPQGFGESR